LSGRAKPLADDAAVRAFAKPLAHELGNLLQVVSGNLELAAARATDEASLRYLANAMAAAEQLAELARRLPVDSPG
jgi:signal transduction histidine kinase